MHSLKYEADFGSGYEVDLELSDESTPWLALSQGVPAADVWLKEAQQGIDLRVQIHRTDTGIRISVDRGEPGVDRTKHWWPKEGVPSLSIRLDPASHFAFATATYGGESGENEVNLGQIEL